MKAIRTSYIGQTDTRPARWKAVDGDGNKALVSASIGTAEDAVRALCERMGWAGDLISGGFGNDEYWVWVEFGSSPRITIKAVAVLPSGLNDEQRAFLADLRGVTGLINVPEAIERHWRAGEHYYIDERVGISKALRRRFDAINDQLLAEANARFEASQKKGGK